MDPNQTNPSQDGSLPLAAPDAQGQNNNGSTATPTYDSSNQTLAQPSSGTTDSSGSSLNIPIAGTTLDSSASQLQPIAPAPTFLGISVDALVVATPLILIGLIIYGWLTGRQPHTDQLSRLDKQRKRIQLRESSKPDNVDIFSKENNDFLGNMLAEAGLEAQYDKMKANWMLAAGGTTVGLAILCMLQAPALAVFSVIFGPALGSFGFVQYVKWQGTQRQRKLTTQLPQALESMVSTLKAGSPVVECFKLLAETTSEPIRGEFRRALISMQLGKPFRDVLAEMGTRIRTPDFRLLTQAIFISQDVGANLADVVATIAEAIRERFRLRDFLAALTAQGKMTALFIGALPYFITASTYCIAPGYIVPFLNHPIARIVFIAMMIWEAIGAYILVRMTTFEV